MGLESKYENESKELTLEIEDSGSEIKVSWLGRSTAVTPGQFLEPIFAELLKQPDKKIIMNFEKLEYMNSSTITPMLSMLEQIKNGKGKIVLQYSASLKWQELSFGALQLFKTNDGRVDIAGV